MRYSFWKGDSIWNEKLQTFDRNEVLSIFNWHDPEDDTCMLFKSKNTTKNLIQRFLKYYLNKTNSFHVLRRNDHGRRHGHLCRGAVEMWASTGQWNLQQEGKSMPCIFDKSGMFCCCNLGLKVFINAIKITFCSATIWSDWLLTMLDLEKGSKNFSLPGDDTVKFILSDVISDLSA